MKIRFMTNKTSHNSSQTGKPGATALAQPPSTRSNKSSKHCRKHSTQTEKQKRWTLMRPAHPVITIGGYRRSNYHQDTLHKEITSHTTITTTSWKDRIGFENSNIFPAFKGLKTPISEKEISRTSCNNLCINLENYSNHRVKP